MAADTVGLMDALGYDSVHLVGASMGGMIAQTLAIEYPQGSVSYIHDVYYWQSVRRAA